MGKLIYILPPLLRELRRIYEMEGEEATDKWVDNLSVENKYQLMKDIEAMEADKAEQAFFSMIRSTMDPHLISRNIQN